MAARQRKPIPEVTVHTTWNLARVRLNGHDVYLGKPGEQETLDEYDRVVSAWMANGRQWPLAPTCDTVADLSDVYLAFAASYYVKRGVQTNTYHNLRRSLELLYRAGVADVAPADFGPRRLKTFQAWLSGAPKEPWARSTINEYVRHVVRMFDWAVSEELVDPGVVQALRAVKPLRKGRAAAAGQTAPREGSKVTPPPPGAVDAAKPFMPQVIHDLVEVQRQTGMRPGEAVMMRVGDIERVKGRDAAIYRVRPEVNKVDHHDIERIVVIGPAALAIITACSIGLEEEDFVFSPKRSELDRNAKKRSKRQSAMTPSQRRRASKQNRGVCPGVGEHYTTNSYRRAIHRACDQADIPRWSPNQLRHEAASRIAKTQKIEVASELLGHTELSTTRGYVNVDLERLLDAVTDD